MKKRVLEQVKNIVFVGVIISLGMLLFKYLPMQIFGREILFDASLHIATACFILYIGYFFVDQNKSLKLYYLLFGLFVLFVISVQRILDNAHNDFGLIMGFIVFLIAIILANWKYVIRNLKF